MKLRRLVMLLTLTVAFGALAAPALAHDGGGEYRGDDPPKTEGMQEHGSEASRDEHLVELCARAGRKLERLQKREARLERVIDRLDQLLASEGLEADAAAEIEDRLESLEDRLDNVQDRIDMLKTAIGEHCPAAP